MQNGKSFVEISLPQALRPFTFTDVTGFTCWLWRKWKNCLSGRGCNTCYPKLWWWKFCSFCNNFVHVFDAYDAMKAGFHSKLKPPKVTPGSSSAYRAWADMFWKALREGAHALKQSCSTTIGQGMENWSSLPRGYFRICFPTRSYEGRRVPLQAEEEKGERIVGWVRHP